MTVRKREWTNADGTTSQCWEIDVIYYTPEGKRKRVRRNAPGTTKREAEAYEKQVLASLVHGTYDTQRHIEEIPTFAEFAEEWMEGEVSVTCKPSTIRTRRSDLDARLIPFFGKTRLDLIGKREIAKFKRACKKDDLSPKRTNNLLGTLSSLFSCAIDWEVIDKAPSISWLKAPKPEIDFLDFDEADRLLEAVEPEWKMMVECGMKTGMRLGELCALRFQNVDLVRAQIRVVEAATRGKVTTPKGGRSRTIPIPSELREHLEAHIKRSRLRGDLVFSREDGSILHRSHVKRILPRACREASLREINWHTLRHTYASHLAMLGVPMKTVQELLGHATLEMTMRYAHLAPDVKAAAVDLLESREVFSSARGAIVEQRKTQRSK